MFAYPEGDTVYVEGYFADGRKAMNSKVTVYDPEGKILFKGITDKKGQLSFKTPYKGDLRIVLDAGMGHRTEYTVNAGDMSNDVSEVTKDPEKLVKQTLSNPDELQLIVEKAVGEAIKPLMKSTSEMKEKIRLSEIIGGIGYILGLMGVALYFKSRSSSK